MWKENRMPIGRQHLLMSSEVPLFCDIFPTYHLKGLQGNPYEGMLMIFFKGQETPAPSITWCLICWNASTSWPIELFKLILTGQNYYIMHVCPRFVYHVWINEFHIVQTLVVPLCTSWISKLARARWWGHNKFTTEPLL